jgi:hypothetical protein
MKLMIILVVNAKYIWEAHSSFFPFEFAFAYLEFTIATKTLSNIEIQPRPSPSIFIYIFLIFSAFLHEKTGTRWFGGGAEEGHKPDASEKLEG